MQPNEPLEIGKTADGRPIKLFWDEKGVHYRPAVQRTDGVWVWSDLRGEPLPESSLLYEYPAPAGLLGGIVGYFVADGLGALIGTLGALLWLSFPEIRKAGTSGIKAVVDGGLRALRGMKGLLDNSMRGGSVCK